MKNIEVALGAALSLAALAAHGNAHAATGDCAGLTRLALPHAQITAAEAMTQYPAADQVDPKGPDPVKVPFCRVEITARPTADSDIRIELWIPSGSGWNGRYLQVGNGGFAGQIPYWSLTAGLRRGYAVAGTDDGHEFPKGQDSTYAGFARGHPQKLVDFGWRALKQATDLSKTVLAAYASPPKFSYFNGCSDGGREALMEAQRFPPTSTGWWRAIRPTTGPFCKPPGPWASRRCSAPKPPSCRSPNCPPCRPRPARPAATRPA